MGGCLCGNAVMYVQERYGVNQLAGICAIDRAPLVTVCDYGAPGAKVTGITELLANAMALAGEKKGMHNLRLEPIPRMQQDGEEDDEPGGARDERPSEDYGRIDSVRRPGDVPDLAHLRVRQARPCRRE